MKLLELGIATTAAQYILGASRILAPLRSRLPARVRRFLACPACCGWWLGVAFGGFFVPIGELQPIELLQNGAAGLVLTAVGRSLMELAVVEEKS